MGEGEFGTNSRMECGRFDRHIDTDIAGDSSVARDPHEDREEYLGPSR